MTMSKTQYALNLVAKGGLTPYAAAKVAKISPSAVYRAIAAAKKKVAKSYM